MNQTALPTPNRERLPNRHACEVVEFEMGGRPFIAHIGRFDDDRLGEIFVSSGKAGSEMEVLMRDAAIVLSVALQSGVDAADIRKSLTRNPNGSASGPVGKILDILASDARKKKANEQPIA